jgi:hypothetical protein
MGVCKVRTSEMPRSWDDRIQLLELFELFGYLLNDIEQQKSLYHKMRDEKLGVRNINGENTQLVNFIYFDH